LGPSVPDDLLDAPLLLCAFALMVGGASALLPVLPIEPLLLAASAAVPTPLLVPVVALATVGHMAAKTLLYLGSRSVAERLMARPQRAALERVRVLLSRRRSVQLVTVLASAVAGVPPFYLVTVCCGLLRFPLGHYVVVSLLGRGFRFGALALVPRLIGGV
jgi:membrane protein YqaA with SNARE-associated domain